MGLTQGLRLREGTRGHCGLGCRRLGTPGAGKQGPAQASLPPPRTKGCRCGRGWVSGGDTPPVTHSQAGEEGEDVSEFSGSVRMSQPLSSQPSLGTASVCDDKKPPDICVLLNVTPCTSRAREEEQQLLTWKAGGDSPNATKPHPQELSLLSHFAGVKIEAQTPAIGQRWLASPKNRV